MITKIGKLIIEDGKMHAIGFDADDIETCRDLAIEVCDWAVNQLLAEHSKIRAVPGSGIMAVDDACEFCGKNEIHGLSKKECDFYAKNR